MKELPLYKEVEKMGDPHFISFSISRRVMVEPHEIIAASQLRVNLVGIYFLINKGEIIYIGQGVNVYARIEDHDCDKEFDSYTVLLCELADIDLLESLYIHWLRPKLNGKHKDGSMFAPLSAHAIVRARENLDALVLPKKRGRRRAGGFIVKNVP